MTAPRKFSAAEFSRLWLDDSLTYAQIAAALGRGAGGLAKVARKLHLPPRRLGPKLLIDEPLLRRLWLAGVSAREIAALMGVNRFSLSNAAARLGLPRRGGGWMPTMTLAQFHEAEMARQMAGTAAQERAALRNAEMVDDPRAFARACRRAA
jgi:hypothetical protein